MQWLTIPRHNRVRTAVKATKNLAYAMMALAAIMWATSGTFTQMAYDEEATAMQITLFSFVFSAMILLPAIAILDRGSLKIRREDFFPFLVFSMITGTFFGIAWYTCVKLTGVATAVILLYAYPSIVTIASVFLLKEGMTKQKALALPLTFIGCILVAGAQDFEEGLTFDQVGIALGLYTAAAGAVYYIWGKKFLNKYSANTVILYMTVLSIPGLVLMANPLELGETSLTMNAWVLIFVIGLFPGTIGFVVSMVALRHIEASKASIVASIEPVAAVAIAFLVLSETINALQGLGVALVFVGVVLLRMTKEAQEPVPVLEK